LACLPAISDGIISVRERGAAERPALKLPDAVIFDMDGLIFDSEVLYAEALLELAGIKGFAAIDIAVARSTVGRSWAGTRAILHQVLPAHYNADAFRREWHAAYNKLAETRLAIKPGVRELLTWFENAGVPCGIATGSGRKIVKDYLSVHGLTQFFSVIVAAEDCSEGKPAPEPYLKAVSALEIEPGGCWALEDSINGVLSASAAGLNTFMIPDLIEPDDDTAALCFAVLPSLLDLHAWLEG
jgi:HAD superfamily hydrolase (TIGR01509 family)